MPKPVPEEPYMTRGQDSWAGWQLKVRVWVEREGVAVLGDGRLDLLEWIDRCRSISAAARQVGMSYRHAWVQVQEINRAAGVVLVEATTGGSHGGGAQLTERGREAIRRFRELRNRLQAEAATLLPRTHVGEAPTDAIHVSAAVSLEDVLGQLAIDYALLRPGRRVRTVLGASDELAEQILAGATSDLFLSANLAQLERLAAAGLTLTAPVKLAENALAAIARADAEIIAKRPAELLGASVPRVALAMPPCPLGRYTRAYLEEMGLYNALLARALRVDNARNVVAAVQSGQAQAGFVYGSAAASTTDCRILFRVPRRSLAVGYAGAVLTVGRQPEQAKDFLSFLGSSDARKRFRRAGFLPGKQR
jgi:molybdenum ABC transporter molybdate-binding protein